MEIDMRQKRVATIQDISCFGKCSLTVALPLISAMGIETAIIPTAVLSTHTGGFENFTFRDLTEDIPDIANHWKSQNIGFDVIYTGYLGSFKQIEYISNFIDSFKTKENTVIIDPAMGDDGSLYTGFTPEFALAMSGLLKKADVVVPNLTEAAFMLNEPYVESGYDEEYVKNILKRLTALGAKNAILTGVSYTPDKTGVVCYSAETDEFDSYFTDKIGGSYPGTGDVYASVCAGAVARGMSLIDAASLAADYVCECIKETLDDSDHWYGVKFENTIPYLVERLKSE